MSKKKEGKKEEKKEEKKEVEVKTRVDVADIKLIELARVTYKRIYQSWLDFALVLQEIKIKEVFKKDHEDMKSFCDAEFPDMGYSVICRLLAVAEDWGPAIKAMKTKKPDAILPSYTTCYELTVHKEDIKEDELARLRKDILERKILGEGLRERLKEIIKKREAKGLKKEIKEDKKLERKIERMERDEDNEEFEIEEEELDDEVSASLDKQAKELLVQAQNIKSNLPVLTSAIKTTTKSIVDLAECLESLEDIISDYLTKASKCSEE
jgi:hypothetical protein